MFRLASGSDPGPHREMIEESDSSPVDVAAAMREAEVDVVVSYLPVGSEQATRFYAQAAIDADAAFVNCIPVFIASNVEWAKQMSSSFPACGTTIC